MGFMQIHLITICAVALIYIVSFTFVSGDDIIVHKRSERNQFDVDRLVDEDRPRKRPFCNAFTGCGKKRTDQSMANLVKFDLDSDVDDLTKRILLEAKLWQAIQLARAKFQRRKEDSQLNSEENLMPPDIPLGITLNNLKKKRSVAKLKNRTTQAEAS